MFDRRDPATKKTLNAFRSVADSFKVEALRSQVSSRINGVALVPLRQLDQSYDALPHYGLQIGSTVTRFEGPGEKDVHLVTLEGREGYEAPSNKLGLYELNAHEFSEMVQGGLYDDPDQFMRDLNDSLAGTEYTQRDYMSVYTTSVVDARTDQLSEIESAQASDHMEIFNSTTENNTFTFLLHDSVAELKNKQETKQATAQREQQYAKQVSDSQAEQQGNKAHGVDMFDNSNLLDLDKMREALNHRSAPVEKQPEVADVVDYDDDDDLDLGPAPSATKTNEPVPGHLRTLDESHSAVSRDDILADLKKNVAKNPVVPKEPSLAEQNDEQSEQIKKRFNSELTYEHSDDPSTLKDRFPNDDYVEPAHLTEDQEDAREKDGKKLGTQDPDELGQIDPKRMEQRIKEHEKEIRRKKKQREADGPDL